MEQDYSNQTKIRNTSEIVGHESRPGGGLRLRDVDLTTGRLTLRDVKDTRKTRAKKTKAGREVWADREAMALLRTYWQDRASGDLSPETCPRRPVSS
jgi:integrase